MNDPIRFKCPICGALPDDPCVRIDGTLTPGPHSGRKSVATGTKPAPRQDFSQAATPAVREATEEKSAALRTFYQHRSQHLVPTHAIRSLTSRRGHI
jgi:hypothetical protein